MMLNTGCQGAMISRAGVGQPWLIQQLVAESQGTDFSPPATSIIGQILLEHVQRLIGLLNNERMAIFQARSFAKYYARRLLNQDKFAQAMNLCLDFSTLENLINTFFF